MFKRLLRWLLRTVLMMLALFLIVLVSQYARHRYRPGSVLVLQLDGTLAERADPSPLGFLNLQPTGLNQIRRALKTAGEDRRIVGLAVKVIDPELELAQAQELCAMISEFRGHGKWTTAYMESAGEGDFGNLPYLVASAAEEVSMMPQGEMNLLGVNIRELFARGMLDKIRVVPNFAAFGKYKSAANIFTEKDFTPAQHEEDEALAGSMFDQIVAGTAAHRHLRSDDVRAIVDRAPLTAADGLKAHLLDRLEYEDQFDDRVKNYRGEHHDLVQFESYMRPRSTLFAAGRNAIAVIYGVGDIQRDGGSDGLSPTADAMNSDDLVGAFKDAREDASVRAVVFRVDSPGGSVIASELIRRAVELTAQKKPVVVSMSGYAASGGYWVSTPAASLIADPGTITGSIGVLGGKFNIAGAADSLGVTSSAISRGANAAMYDTFTDFTPAQQQIFRDQILGGTYQYFLKLVAKQRHMTVAQVDDVAQGRVWTGEQALKVKLIDKLGGLDDAIKQARTLAKLDPQTPVRIEELPTQPSLFGKLLGSQLYSGVFAQLRMDRALQRVLWMVRENLARRAAMGEVYCPVVPVL